MGRKKADIDKITRELNSLPKDIPMNQNKFNQYYKEGKISVCYKTLGKLFGSIEKICKVGGLLYITISKELLIKELNALPKDIPMTKVKFDQYYREGKISVYYKTLGKLFGSIEKICKVGGLLYKHTRSKYVKLSKDQIIINIIDIGKRGPILISDIDIIYQKQGKLPSSVTLRNLFGTFYNIEQMTGIKFIDKHLGKYETHILDTTETEKNIKIIRNYQIERLNGKKYYPDGYCKETNTVYEVYENKHRWAIEDDKKRQLEIENLGYNFVIILDNKFFETHEKPF